MEPCYLGCYEMLKQSLHCNDSSMNARPAHPSLHRRPSSFTTRETRSLRPNLGTPVPNHDVRRAPYALIGCSEGVRSKSHDISTRGPDLRTRPHDCFGCEPMFHPHRTTVFHLNTWSRLNGTADQDTNKACHPHRTTVSQLAGPQ